MYLSFRRHLTAAALLGLLVTAAGTAQAQIVTNGDFATGDFTGWTLSGDTGDAFVSGVPGDFSAALTTSTATGFLTQNLATVIGQEYTVSFLLGGDGATPNSFLASLGGTPLVSLTDVPLSLSPFTPYSYSYTATAASSLLSFGVRNDAGYLYLTNVSVVPAAAIPEPSQLATGGLCAALTAGCLWRNRRRKAGA